MKYLVVILVVVVMLWLMLRGAARGRTDEVRPRAANKNPAPEGMVQCAHCGVHLPRREALLVGEGAFCSDAHRSAGPRPS